MSHRKWLATLATLALFPLTAFGADISGTWTASFGTVVSADEIKFSRDVMGIAQEELVAKRAK